MLYSLTCTTCETILYGGSKFRFMVCRLIVWDGGHNGIQVHFTDIKDLVQQNSILGNVSWFRVTNRRVFIDSLIILKKHMQI